ncbi:hypothetical protein [Qipengyuania sp.]|uniref:hypothetical protein n=1 Tax=Qipengyuania sp. TaxID=2004515 RepID=UPI003BABB016
MDHEFSTGLAKKLAIVAIFLVAVALLVGGEDNPGVIGQLGDVPPDERAAAVASPAARSGQVRTPRSREDDRSLSAWYAESESAGPAEPQPFQPTPIDHSHLVNDAQPMIESAPAPPPGAVRIAPVPVERGE